jgi:serine/threonine protein kinase
MEPGTGGAVYLIEHLKTKERNVLKTMFVNDKKKEEFEKQIKFWKELCSKEESHIVILKEYFYDESSGCLSFYSLTDSVFVHIYLLVSLFISLGTIMEFCSHGDLATRIERKKLEGEKFSEFVCKNKYSLLLPFNLYVFSLS